jgi:hypothetical protein
MEPQRSAFGRVGLTEQLAILVQEGLDAARRVPVITSDPADMRRIAGDRTVTVVTI